MINRAGGQIINGKTYWWINWYIDELMLDQPLFKLPDMTVVDEWLPEIFDDRTSAHLMPMPKENWN